MSILQSNRESLLTLSLNKCFVAQDNFHSICVFRLVYHIIIFINLLNVDTIKYQIIFSFSVLMARLVWNSKSLTAWSYFRLQRNPLFCPERCCAFQCDLTEDDLREHVAEASVDVITLIFVLSAIHPDKMKLALQNISRVRDRNSGQLNLFWFTRGWIENIDGVICV